MNKDPFYGLVFYVALYSPPSIAVASWILWWTS